MTNTPPSAAGISTRHYNLTNLSTLLSATESFSLIQAESMLLAHREMSDGQLSVGLLKHDVAQSCLGVIHGSLQQSLFYSPYGHNPLLASVRMGYAGMLFEPALCAYSAGNGYRFYSPGLMRFISPDAWSPFGRGGINAYVYCSGDPINRIDRSGKAWFMNIKPSFTGALKRIGAMEKTHMTSMANDNNLDKGQLKRVVKRARNTIATPSYNGRIKAVHMITKDNNSLAQIYVSPDKVTIELRDTLSVDQTIKFNELKNKFNPPALQGLSESAALKLHLEKLRLSISSREVKELADEVEAYPVYIERLRTEVRDYFFRSNR